MKTKRFASRMIMHGVASVWSGTGAALILAALVSFAGPTNSRAADQENCLLCHRYSGMGLFEKDGTERVFYVNEDLHRRSVHGNVLCSSCHTDIKEIPHKPAKKVDCSSECHLKDPSSEKPFSHKKIMDEFTQSVHGRKRAGMEGDSPTCVYCHTNPLYQAGEVAQLTSGPVYRALERCKSCHEEPRWAERFFSHVSMRMSSRLTGSQVVDLCATCHEDAEKMSRHGLESTWTLKDTFHWEGIKYDSPNAPNCVTCHVPAMEKYSVHNIRSVKDPLSPFADKQKRVKICANQGCHPAATEQFVSGKVHTAGGKIDVLNRQTVEGGSPNISTIDKALLLLREKREKQKAQVIALLKLAYQFLIAGTIGFFLFHQVLDFRATLRERKQGPHPSQNEFETEGSRIFVQRLTKVELYQHGINAVAFVILAVTGFMALIPLDTVQSWFGASGKTMYAVRGVVHRTAAGVMISVLLWHIGYIAFTRNGRSYFRDMLPTRKDGKDLIDFFKFALGKKSERPKCGRFDYREKIEYLTGQAGTVIVTITGLTLVFASFVPKFIVDIFQLVHLMEAILATLAITVWHMYAVHMKPGKFPASTAFLDGKLPLHEMEEEHPTYYEEVLVPKLRALDQSADPILEVVRGARAIDRIAKSLAVKVFITCSVLGFVIIDGFLIKSLYYKEAQPQTQVLKELNIFERILQAESKLKREHFHNLDTTISVENRVPTLCLRCHGNRPHARSKEVRSLLNMHTYFAACELCHTQPADLPPGSKATLKINWYDNKTREVISTITPKNGDYNAKLVPSIVVDGKRVTLDRPVTESYAQQFVEEWAKYSPDQQAKAKAEVHRGVSQKPMQCDECHRREAPYLDFAALGYPKNWVDQLTGTEVVGMVNKYLTFYIPTMFNPDEIRKQREESMRLREKGAVK